MAAPVGRTPSHAGAILGMYALLATAVGCVGASAGELFFAADRNLFHSLPGRAEPVLAQLSDPDARAAI